MPLGARSAALVAALIACLVLASAAGAAERPPKLVAQFAQTQQPEEPELSEDPPTELQGDGEEEPAEPESTPEPAAEAEDDEAAPRERELARTGSDAGMIALAGFALLGWGLALRLRVRDAA